MKPIHTFAAALALSTALTGTAFAATKVGVIGAANPQVYVEREGAARTVLQVGDEIFLNDKLSTDGKGSAQLMFLDKSALTISPESLVTIDTFVYDPAAKDGTMTVNGAKGAFRFIGGALTKKKAVNFKTPVSTIGIRGGIVDTHIAAGGQTDAVFLFGKEMTMTNGAGQTTSTTQFGTGIGLANAGAAPLSLPQNVVAARINASPTQAAVAAAPPASPAQINALESKVQMDSGATTGADQGAPPAAPSGGADSAPTPAGESNDGGNGGASPAEAPQQEGNAGDTSGNAPVADAGPKPTAAAPNAQTNAGPAPAPQTSAPAATAPTPAASTPAFGGFAEGAGLKAAPIAPIAVDTGALGAEDLRAKVDNFVNSGGESDGSGFDISRARPTGNQGATPNGETNIFQERVLAAQPEPVAPVEAPIAQAPADDAPEEVVVIIEDPQPQPNPPSASNQGPTDAGSVNLAAGNEHDLLQNRRRTFTQSELLAGISDPEGDALSVVAGSLTIADATHGGASGLELTAQDIAPGDTRTITVNYNVTDGANIINVTRDITITGQDFFGGTTAWDTSNTPALPQAATKRGQMFHRAENSTSSDLIEVGKLEAVVGTSDTTAADYAARYDGKHVFHMEKKHAYTSDYTNSVALPTASDPSNYVIGFIDMPTGTGMKTLLESDVHFEDHEGRVRVNANDDFTGFGYETTDGSFTYAQVKWTDDNGTSADSSDDEVMRVRSYLNSTPLLGAADLTDAQGKYDTMLGDAMSNATVTGGIVEYDFLPELGAHQNGMIDYNYADGLSAHAYSGQNSNGLFIDWTNKKFLGGYVDFTGNTAGTPSINALFGKVNDGGAAVTGFIEGDGGTGIALNGSYFNLSQGGNFSTSSSATYGVNAASESLASTGTSGAAIEALVLQTNDGNNTRSQQAAVMGDGATQTLLDNPTTGPIAYGFSAGLTTDSSNNVSRLATGYTTAGYGHEDFKVDVNAAGTVGVTVKYKAIDSNDNYTAGTSSYVANFGGSGATNAALQNDLMPPK
jgi:hypothetical protein